jgi:hypothetical protein
MKKALFTLIALIISATSFAQLIANKTDKKITFGLDLFNDFQLAPSSNWDPRMVNQGVSCALTYNFPLGESAKHTVSIGLGVSSHNYFSYSRILNPYTNGDLVLKNYRDVEGFKRFKVNPVYGEVPLVLNFRIKDQVKIGIGFKVGVMIATKTRFVGPDDTGTLTDEEGNTLTLTGESGATINEKYQYISNIERMAYSATFRIGWKWVSAYVAYQFNPIFSVGHEAPVFHPLSVGVTFAPF